MLKGCCMYKRSNKTKTHFSLSNLPRTGINSVDQSSHYDNSKIMLFLTHSFASPRTSSLMHQLQRANVTAKKKIHTSFFPEKAHIPSSSILLVELIRKLHVLSTHLRKDMNSIIQRIK